MIMLVVLLEILKSQQLTTLTMPHQYLEITQRAILLSRQHQALSILVALLDI